MHRRNYLANFNAMQFFLDCFVIFLAYSFTDIILYLARGYFIGLEYIRLYFIFTMVFSLVMIVSRMNDVTTFCYLSRIVNRSLAAAVLGGLCIGASIFFSGVYDLSRMFILLFCFFGFTFVTLGRLAVRLMKKKFIGNGYVHTIFICDGDKKDQLVQFIAKTSIKMKVDRHIGYDHPAVSDVRIFENLLRSSPVDEVVIVYTDTFARKNIEAVMELCDAMGITVRLVLDLPEFPNSKRFVSSFGTYPVLTYHSVPYNKVSLFIKSAMDVIGAIAGLVLFSPIFLFTAIAIKLDSPGPVFFKQPRVGRNGLSFKMYKFRSMYADAENRKNELMAINKIKGDFMFKLDNDPRVTRVGKFIRRTSIDELPQFINVLMKNMSLVGTRPPTPDEVVHYNRDHWRRISITPGITGIWQTSGRSGILDFNEVVKMDTKYIDEWSLALDVKLLFKTFSSVVKMRGAA